MNNLKKNIPLHLVAFGSSNYLTEEENEKLSNELLDIISNNLKKRGIDTIKIVINSEIDIRKLAEDKNQNNWLALFLAMSGGTQSLMLQASQIFDVLGFPVIYNDFFVDKRLSDIFLLKNSAPALMDTYAVIKRNKKYVQIFTDLESVLRSYRSCVTFERLKKTTLLRIGEVEPWVLSSSKKINLINDIFGINVISIPQKELENEFVNIKDDYVYSLEWEKNAKQMIEVTQQDIRDAYRLSVAINNLKEKYSSDGVCIACFNLLKKINTTACLSMSMLNDTDVSVGGCEGDIDSAITLMVMKALTGKPGWIANPMIENNNFLMLSHCSAPRYQNTFKYDLMRHHESGIGVSPRVYIPENVEVTLSRIGNDFSKINIFMGKTSSFKFKNTCRTQALIQIEDIDYYKENVLGCHLIMTIGNFTSELKLLADMVGLVY